MRKSLPVRKIINPKFIFPNKFLIWNLGIGICCLLLTKEGFGGEWGVGGGVGVALPAGGLGRDLKGGPRLEVVGGREVRSGLRIQGGLRIFPLKGKREGVEVNLLSAGLSALYKTSTTREKISLLISGGLGWDWINRSFQTGREKGSGPFLSGEGGVSLPFGSAVGGLDLEGLLIFHRILSQEPGDIVSFGLRIWYNFNEK